MTTAANATGRTNEGSDAPAFLIFDTESVPDGRLLSLVKYADEGLSAEEAVRRAQTEARERSANGDIRAFFSKLR